MARVPPGDPDRPDPAAVTQPLPALRANTAIDAPAPPPYAPIFGSIGSYAFARFAGLLFDFVALPAIFACFAFNLADRGTLAFAPRTEGGFATIAALSFAAATLFAFVFESIFETTIGKAFFGLGVRRGTGRHAGPQRIFVRYLLLPVDLLAIGAILALVTRRHQRLGDFAAGTVVARHRSGGFATAFAFVLVAALIYAQATIGGGLNSALAVTAESAYFLPTLVAGALADAGLAPRPAAPPPLPDASATPQAPSTE